MLNLDGNLALYRGFQPLWASNPAGIRVEFDPATPTLLVLLHGLCMNDLQWHGETATASGYDYDYATRLARELGYTPVYLHYNTGLHTSVNGGQFAALLEGLLQA